MRKNVFGVKNITSLIYGLVMLLPFFAILGRVIYTQSNPNAKDSYTGQVQKVYSTYLNNTIPSELPTGSEFTYYFVNTPLAQQSGHSGWFVFDSISYDYDLLFVPTRFRIKFTSPQQLQFNDGGTSYTYQPFADFNFTLKEFNDTDTGIQHCTNMFYQSLVSVDTLDNAFEYSINEFTKDNNFGEIDCFSWFTDVFLDSSNAKNMLYINFLNWYLNYTLFASCGYIMFLVIYWFINFVRRILDKSMYQEYGGF